MMRCDGCGAELEAHDDARHDWQIRWSDEHKCMQHWCPRCTGATVTTKKARKR